MLEIFNTKVYDLEESVYASGFAMQTEYVDYSTLSENERILAFSKGLTRMQRLVKSSAKDPHIKCHDNAITGIRVSFDIRYPQYISPELQRYHFFDIVTSASKMHRLLKFNLDKCCNKYVDQEVINILKQKIFMYNHLLKQYSEGINITNEQLYTSWMEVISNCPLGLELFMRCSTNYKQLQTIYYQRKHHKLREDWGAIITWIESLPYAKELILGGQEDED